METWNTVFGGFLASALGLGAFFVQEHFRKKAEKYKVANALMNEMFHTLKFLTAGHTVLTKISKKSGSVPVRKISLIYPSRRAIYVTLGSNVGALSEKATEAAVNFDHYIQALERDFDSLVGVISPGSNIDPDTALRLASAFSRTIERTENLVECMADEVGSTVNEATKKKVQDLKKIVGFSD